MHFKNKLIKYKFFKIQLKDLPTGDSLFSDVPKDLFDQIPQAISSSEERKHEKFVSRTKKDKSSGELSIFTPILDHLPIDPKPLETEGLFSL